MVGCMYNIWGWKMLWSEIKLVNDGQEATEFRRNSDLEPKGWGEKYLLNMNTSWTAVSDTKRSNYFEQKLQIQILIVRWPDFESSSPDLLTLDMLLSYVFSKVQF